MGSTWYAVAFAQVVVSVLLFVRPDPLSLLISAVVDQDCCSVPTFEQHRSCGTELSIVLHAAKLFGSKTIHLLPSWALHEH